MVDEGNEIDTSRSTPAAPETVTTHVEPVMGTVATITVVAGDLDRVGLQAALARGCEELHRADSIFSTWNVDSPMSRVRRGELDLADAPEVIREVLELCDQARTASAGWFDPWAMPGGVDPTGLVKGWAVERARDVLVRAGVAGVMVNAGGDLAVSGTAPGHHGGHMPGCRRPHSRWRIGITHPWKSDSLARVIEVDGSGPGSAVATSGTYERGPHLLDPWSGRPRCSLASATVVGPSLAMADAFATALAVGGDRVLVAPWRSLGGYEAYLIRPDGSELATPGVVTWSPEE